MNKSKNTVVKSSACNNEKTKWVASAQDKKELSGFVARAGKLASYVNESRIIPSSIVKEPFTV